MGFLYQLTNVVVPVSLLVYQTLTKFRLSQQIPYGKWTVMISAIYLFNWISWIFSESYLIFFIDLLIKLAVSFIPDIYNQKIQQIVSNLHLEIWLDQFRCWMIAALHKYYWKVTQYLLSKMELNESKQFREGLYLKLNGQTDQNTQQFVFQPAKHYTNVGVNCDKFSNQIAENISNTAKKLQEFSKKIIEQKTLHNETFGQIKPTKESTYKESTIKQSKSKKQQLPKFHYKKKQQGQKLVKSKVVQNLQNLKLKQSQQQIDFSDNEIEQQRPHVISPIHNKQKDKKVQSHVVFKTVSKKGVQSVPKRQTKLPKLQQDQNSFKRTYTFTEYTSSQLSSHPENTKKAYRQDGQAFSDELINKLQLSSSEYSDMFDEEDDQDLKVLECKVQVILQIGTGASVRLQIYNIELYSNRDLRIVSLYDREFENHKLKSMKALTNGYYELIFQEGKIHSRKCKFRGQHQPFMKYLEQ